MSRAHRAAERPDSRRGVALILVLGMLSVMLVLAVAFAITMRTERTAAGNYLEVVQARQLLYASLARALEDLDQDMSKYGTPYYPTGWGTNRVPSTFRNAVDLRSGEAGKVVPSSLLAQCGRLPSKGWISETNGSWMMAYNADWADNSLAARPLGPWVGGARVEAAHDSGYVMENKRNEIRAQSDRGGSLTWGNWYRITEPPLPQWSPVEGGRIAYLIVNVSGLLDPNYVGQAPEDRGGGSNVAEIMLSDLPDVGSESAFIAGRNSEWYETLYALAENNRGIVSSGPRNFFPYTRYPGDVDGHLPASLSGTVKDLKNNKDDIEGAFRRAVQDNRLVAENLFINLIDYVDDDYIPGNLGVASDNGDPDGPYAEAIPMINEIMVTNRIVVDATGQVNGRQSTLDVKIECFYPFVNEPTETFRLKYAFRFDLKDGPASAVPAGPVVRTRTLNNVNLKTRGYELISTVRHNIPSMPNPTNVAYDVVFDNLEIEWNGKIVDRAPHESLTLTVNLRNLKAGEETSASVGYECVDPRLNWHVGRPSENWWKPSKDAGDSVCSPGTTNFFTRRYLADGGNDQDATTDMYVANRPLGCVGELGYLFSPGADVNRRPKPWKTVWLYDHGDGKWDRVFDHLVMEQTNDVLRGRLNINTQCIEPLAAVLDEMPVGRYHPGDTKESRIDWVNARRIADAIRGVTYYEPLERLSDLGRRDFATNIFANLLSPDAGELEKESFFRTCGNLVHTRHNVFMILLGAQTTITPQGTPQGPGKERTDQRALAVVWRDPKPDANGHHPMFLRWFTWLKKD